jgi:hypothetical protein
MQTEVKMGWPVDWVGREKERVFSVLVYIYMCMYCPNHVHDHLAGTLDITRATTVKSRYVASHDEYLCG